MFKTLIFRYTLADLNNKNADDIQQEIDKELNTKYCNFGFEVVASTSHTYDPMYRKAYLEIIYTLKKI